MNTNDTNRQKAHAMIDHIFKDLLPARGMAERSEQIKLSHRISNANTAAFPFLWIRMRRSKKLPTKCRRMNARRRTLMFPLRRSFG